LKVAHFSWEYPPAIWGGLGTFAYELTQKQISKGYNVSVFAINNQNKMKVYDKNNGFEIYRPYNLDLSSTLSIFSNDDLRSWGENFKFFADVVNYNYLSASFFVNELVKKEQKKYDLIDGHDWLGIIGGIVAKKELDIPLFFHVHSTEGGRSLGDGSNTIKKIEFEGGQSADCVITVSHAMREELQQIGFPKDKIRVCWNGVDPNKYDPKNISLEEKRQFRHKYGIKDDETMVFFIGRLVTVKGADKLVQSFPAVLEEFPKAKLFILGIGDMENEIRNQLTKLNIEENVIIHNEFVNEKERILHYAASDLVVLPSLYEPFGIVCTEAMSMAKPVVVGARGTNGMREQIIINGEKKCGIHVNPFDPKDIAWGIKKILGSGEMETMGKNGRNRVFECFSWDSVEKRTSEIYKEFIK
jgi:glycosyltransferase involved in cell wall biosynthesis